MAEVTVKLMRVRQSPRKLRLVADLIRANSVAQAATKLDHLGKRAAQPIGKLVKSAVAAAIAKNLDRQKLVINELRVDEGPRLKRWLPAPRGRSYRIRKPTSHITLTVSDELKGKDKPKSKAKMTNV